MYDSAVLKTRGEYAGFTCGSGCCTFWYRPGKIRNALSLIIGNARIMGAFIIAITAFLHILKDRFLSSGAGEIA
jgi:hypothetical protein